MMRSYLISFTAAISLVGCGISSPSTKDFSDADSAGESERDAAIAIVDLKSLPETIGIEYQDRVNRFNRLANAAGITAPEVDELQVVASQLSGVSYDVPVLRLRFAQQVFFDFDSDSVRSDAEPLLQLIAENMRRDVPDVQVTVLGHTDAIGGGDYNIQLSQKRAAAVMGALIRLGVNPANLSTVAVGETQPIAPNYTEDGRAKNRRVEFMLSANEQANLVLVSKRRVNADYLKADPRAAAAAAASPQNLAVLKPLSIDKGTSESGQLKLRQTGRVATRKAAPDAEIAKVAPPPDIKKMTPKEYSKAKLKSEFEI